MLKKKLVTIFFTILFSFLLILLIYFKLYKIKKTEIVEEKNDNAIYNSNIIRDVEYITKDKDGNEYFIKANEDEIDFSNTNVIFLREVKALIKLIGDEDVTIISDFGKYNSINNDTIFSKNVIINYLDNKINGEYLDFSLKRNSMIISKNVIYTNTDNILKADVIEINIKSKDTKIFMHDQNNKVKIKSKN